MSLNLFRRWCLSFATLAASNLALPLAGHAQVRLPQADQAASNSAGMAHAVDSAFVGVYKKEAWCYDQRGYGVMDSDKWVPCKKKQYDVLSIRPAGEDLYLVDFSFVMFATTVGSCELSGLFQLKDKRLVVSDKDSALTAEGCVMEIESTPDELLFHDPQFSCQQRHCGRNQNIEGASFPKHQQRSIKARRTKKQPASAAKRHD